MIARSIVISFSDEQNIKGGLCVGGNVWHRQMLVNIVEEGLLYNACECLPPPCHGMPFRSGGQSSGPLVCVPLD